MLQCSIFVRQRQIFGLGKFPMVNDLTDPVLPDETPFGVMA